MAIRIAIVGVGAIGGFLGGMLARFYAARTDADIYFVARGEALRKIRAQGLLVRTPEGTSTCIPALATDRPEEIGPVDYLFFGTKSYDLVEAAQQAMPCVGPHTIVVPFLNGVFAHEALQRMFPPQQVWWGCVYIYAKVDAPGEIYEHTLGYDYMYGGPDADPARLEELDGIFSKAGMRARSYPDIQTRVWTKFAFVSTIATISSYVQMDFGSILADPVLHETYDGLIDEFCTVAEAKGIEFQCDIRKKTKDDMVHFPPDTTSSMQRDFQNHHKTELEALVGYVVREAARLHVPVPRYEKIYTALKQQTA